jgi:Zn finger protein HypA/HybF involved in hydrogenase expression
MSQCFRCDKCGNTFTKEINAGLISTIKNLFSLRSMFEDVDHPRCPKCGSNGLKIIDSFNKRR